MEKKLRNPKVQRSEPFTIKVDGSEIKAYPGESVLSVLIAAGIRTIRSSAQREQPRGGLCGMGTCYECLVTADGTPHVRSCMLEATPGMEIRLEKKQIL